MNYGGRLDESVETAIDQYLEERGDVLDPFNRERLKRLILKNVSHHLDRTADWTATETLRRAAER